MRWLAVLLALALSSCSWKLYEKPPEEVLIALCGEFTKELKPKVAWLINLDAMRAEHLQQFDHDDLWAIREANKELNSFCPPPAGFTPTSITLQSAQSAFNVYLRYATKE